MTYPGDDLDVHERKDRNRRFALGAVAGVVAGGLLTVGGLALVQPKSKATAPKPTKTASVTASKSPEATPSQAPTPSMLTPTVAAIVTAQPSGTYLALFKWLDKAKYTPAQAAAFAAQNAKAGYTFVAIDGDSVKGLRTGSYGIGVAGLKSKDDVNKVCADLGLANNNQLCWARRVP